jgi:hypothetical protein
MIEMEELLTKLYRFAKKGKKSRLQIYDRLVVSRRGSTVLGT